MAQDANGPEVDVVEGFEDNAKNLTGGLVFATTAVLLIAFIVMEMALGHWFKIGPFA
jgi:hypothetical protein